ncbi:MAG: carbohydrate porin [Phycisphaerales bacterium]
MPNEHFSITAGFMDGAATVDGVRTGLQGPDSFFNDDRSDDYVYLAEANFFWEGGRAGLGFWHHDGDFTRFLGGTESGTSGFYALAEHRIWNADDDRGIDLFAQLGFGDEAVNDVALHLAAGACWVGPWSSRPDDATGIYITFIDLSEDAGYTDDETVIELFYKLQLTPFLSIKPDLQYIIDPAGNSTIDDALVMGLRLEASF